jgi:hypothetical protein
MVTTFWSLESVGREISGSDVINERIWKVFNEERRGC